MMSLNMSEGVREMLNQRMLGAGISMDANKGALNVLQLVFGLTYSQLSVYLQFRICLIVETFCDDTLARVSIPSMEEIETFAAAVGERHLLLNDCWATMTSQTQIWLILNKMTKLKKRT
jgi:hypothetical protein